jgi:DNA-binding CsgD family transcriptional regulator
VRSGDDAFEHLLHLVYEAPLRRDGWRAFLRAVCEATESRAACMQWLSLDSRRSRLDSVGVEPDALALYEGRFAALDPWARVRVAPGDDLFGDEMVARRALESTEFYADFCRPHAIRDIHKSVISRSADRVQSSLGLLKARHTAPVRNERRLTRRLLPHLQRSLALRERHAAMENARGALAEALDHDVSGVFFLDASQRVRFCNRTGQRMLQSLDGLRLVRGTLHAARPEDDRALRLHVAETVARHSFGASSSTGPVVIRRPSGRSPYCALAVPLRNRPEDGTVSGIISLLFVKDPESGRRGPASEATLRRLFGLTFAETRVALLVGRGISPKEAAERLDVSWYTVRAQLRQIFAKTGAKRQSALVDVLARLDGIAVLDRS